MPDTNANDDRFARFRDSGRSCDDLGLHLEDNALEGIAGRVYCDTLFIEYTPARERGSWYTIIGNSEYQSDDLESIERRLYEFAESEGYTF